MRWFPCPACTKGDRISIPRSLSLWLCMSRHMFYMWARSWQYGSNSNEPIILVVCRVRDMCMMPHHELCEGLCALFKMSVRPRLDALSMQCWTHGYRFYKWTVMNGDASVACWHGRFMVFLQVHWLRSLGLRWSEWRLAIIGRDVYCASPPATNYVHQGFLVFVRTILVLLHHVNHLKKLLRQLEAKGK